MAASSGSWQTVFILAVAMNLVAAFMALIVLKPLRLRMNAAPVENAEPVRA
jgi:OFA family oxalate/formate antiporter-like MFS transporter